MSEVLEMPIGYYSKIDDKWFKHIELKGLDSESLVSLGDKKGLSNPYQAFLKILQRGVKSIQNDAGDLLPDYMNKLRHLHYADVLFCVIELIILTKGESKTTTSYKCPKCNDFTTFDFDEDDELGELDNREDIRSIKLNIIPRTELDKDEFLFTSEKGFVGTDEGKLNIYLMEYTKLKTYIDVFNFTENPLEQEREALYRSMKNVNGLDESAMNRLKTKYGRKMFLPVLSEYTKLKKKLRKVGYNLDEHSTKCDGCGNKYKTKFDITNFFVSILPA